MVVPTSKTAQALRPLPRRTDSWKTCFSTTVCAKPNAVIQNDYPTHYLPTEYCKYRLGTRLHRPVSRSFLIVSVKRPTAERLSLRHEREMPAANSGAKTAKPSSKSSMRRSHRKLPLASAWNSHVASMSASAPGLSAIRHSGEKYPTPAKAAVLQKTPFPTTVPSLSRANMLLLPSIRDCGGKSRRRMVVYV